MSDTEKAGERASSSSTTLGVAVPLLVFLVISGVFLYALFSLKPQSIPSPLLGKVVPEFELKPIEGVSSPGFSTKDLQQGKVSVVNVWASWCAPCRQEHAHLITLKNEAKVPLFGMNQKDLPSNAKRFLNELGNPYDKIGADVNGRASISWGVYGIPETFVVGRDGRIAYRHVGPIDPTIIREKIVPLIDKLRKEN